MDVFRALVEVKNIDTALELFESQDFRFYEGITTHKELGKYYIDEGLFGIEIPDKLANYIDYKSIGRDFAMNMTETSYGYIMLF